MEESSAYFFSKSEQCRRLAKAILAKNDPAIDALRQLAAEFEAKAIEIAIRESNALYLANSGRLGRQGPACTSD